MTSRGSSFRFLDHDVWYENEGEGATPIIVVHGGPAAGHDYLDGFRDLAKFNRVVLYDQLGCGRSPYSGDIDWGMDHFVDELEALRGHLGASRVILVGHSWGGMVALEYALRIRNRVAALVLASTASAMADVRASLSKTLGDLRDRLPTADQGEVEKLFWREHVCRLMVWPDSLWRSARNQQNNRVSLQLYGPSEFELTGTLKDWSVRDRLREITCPTLVTAGAFDELSAECWMPMLKGIPRARAVLFGGSSHTPHLEEPDSYFSCLEAFIERAGAFG